MHKNLNVIIVYYLVKLDTYIYMIHIHTHMQYIYIHYIHTYMIYIRYTYTHYLSNSVTIMIGSDITFKIARN